MRTIINADDFGFDENVTQGILDSFRNGWITQTTLMVNMPYADKAVELAKQAGVADKVGLHFNITDGVALSEEMRKSMFCDSNGRFDNMRRVGIRRFRSYDTETVRAIRAEAEAQVRKYLSYGLPLLHCDSHNHLHMQISIAKVLFPVLQKYHFKTVRRPYNVGLKYGMHDILRRVRNMTFLHLMRKYNLCSTDYFAETSQARQCSLLSGNSVEYMVHPLYDPKTSKTINVTDYKLQTGCLMSEALNISKDR